LVQGKERGGGGEIRQQGGRQKDERRHHGWRPWHFCRTSSSVRLCWELEEPKGPKGMNLGAEVPEEKRGEARDGEANGRASEG